MILKRVRESFESIYWAIYRGWNYYWGPFALERNIRKFVERGLHGYSKQDTWSLDDYLTEIIIGGVTELSEATHGVPTEIAEQWGGDHDGALAEWRLILNTIVEGFKANKRLSEHEHWEGGVRNYKLEGELVFKRDAGMKLFVRWFDALWS